MAQLARMKGNTKKPSRLRKRCWMGTWWEPNHGYVAQLHNTFMDLKCEWIFQYECGSKSERYHVHIGIYFKNPIGTNFQKKFSSIIHWEFGNWKHIKKYCCKVRTRINGPWTNMTDLIFRDTLRDPLRNQVLYRWQSDLKKLILTETSEFRKIFWYWERNGNMGKTSFARHIKILLGSQVLYINGCSKDILCAFAKTCTKTDIKVCFFGLTRQDASHMSYKTLEIFGDGIGFSGKYESSDLIFNPPFVIVFSNFPPDESEVSVDRWNIIHISRNTLSPVTAENRSCFSL